MMLSTWTKITVVPEPTKLQDIMVEEAQQKVQEENKNDKDLTASNISNKSENYDIVYEDINIHLDGENDIKSDEIIARRLQQQFDKENVYKRIQPTVNTISDDSDNKLVQILVSDEESESEEEEKEWESETVKQEISKYDMMPNFPGTLKRNNIPYSSHCSLKSDGILSQPITKKLDEAIRLELDKLIQKKILKSVNAVISIGKEFAILHADYYSKSRKSRQCLLKVLLTSPTKKNCKKDIKLRVKRETMNFLQLNKLKYGSFRVPKIIGFKNNILFMSVDNIGKGWINALTLQDAVLNPEEYSIAYNEMYWLIWHLYYYQKLTYVNWSASNILWYDNRCYIIDCCEVVKFDHIDVFTLLLAVCTDIIKFFHNKIPSMSTPVEMFTRITCKNYNDKEVLEAVIKSAKEQGI